MTLKTALLQGTKLLEDAAVPAPRLTAEVLLSHALQRDRVYLYAHSEDELTELAWIHYGRYLHERMQGKPTQYITRRQEFYGREFRVTRDVLIPRPETEHVIEVALQVAPRPGRILDIGTGSGAIAITLALETKARTIATDISDRAARLAAENASRLGAAVQVVVCDLGAAIAPNSIDLMVSNPPYVPLTEREGMQREVRDWEPEVALFAGESGFEIYERIAAEAPNLLRPDGWLVLELGFASAARVQSLLASWRNLQIIPDLAGIPRVIAAQKSLF